MNATMVCSSLNIHILKMGLHRVIFGLLNLRLYIITLKRAME